MNGENAFLVWCGRPFRVISDYYPEKAGLRPSHAGQLESLLVLNTAAVASLLSSLQFQAYVLL